MNVVIFKLSPLGDTVMMLPVVQTIRRRHPDWRVAIFVTPATAELFRDTVPASDLIVLESAQRQRCWRRPWQLLSWWWRVRRLRPDAVFLSYDQSSVARFIAGQSGARVRVGGAGSVVRWSAGLTHTIEKSPAHTLAEWDWAMARAMMNAFGENWPGALPPPAFAVNPEQKFPNARPRILIHAGASRDYQRWLPDRFAALATGLARDCDVVWIDRAEVTVPAPAGVTVATPAGLKDFLLQVAGVDLFVGNHSGAYHLAAALGRACVVVAGPSPFFCDPPWHRERHQILRAPGLACLPCDQLTVSAGQCHNAAQPMACMKHWSVEAVAAVCRDRLKQPSAVQRLPL